MEVKTSIPSTPGLSDTPRGFECVDSHRYGPESESGTVRWHSQTGVGVGGEESLFVSIVAGPRVVGAVLSERPVPLSVCGWRDGPWER